MTEISWEKNKILVTNYERSRKFCVRSRWIKLYLYLKHLFISLIITYESIKEVHTPVFKFLCVLFEPCTHGKLYKSYLFCRTDNVSDKIKINCLNRAIYLEIIQMCNIYWCVFSYKITQKQYCLKIDSKL